MVRQSGSKVRNTTSRAKVRRRKPASVRQSATLYVCRSCVWSEAQRERDDRRQGDFLLEAINQEIERVPLGLRVLEVTRSLVEEGEAHPLALDLVVRTLEHIDEADANAANAVPWFQLHLASLLGFDSGTIVYEPVGCPSCNNTGFAGRIGVFEAVRVDETIRRLINDNGDEAIIALHAFLKQPNLSSAARKLVASGQTTPEEAIRISRREDVDA